MAGSSLLPAAPPCGELLAVMGNNLVLVPVDGIHSPQMITLCGYDEEEKEEKEKEEKEEKDTTYAIATDEKERIAIIGISRKNRLVLIRLDLGKERLIRLILDQFYESYEASAGTTIFMALTNGYLLLTQGDRSIRLLDAVTGEVLTTLDEQCTYLSNVIVVPGTKIFAFDTDLWLWTYDPATKKLQKYLEDVNWGEILKDGTVCVPFYDYEHQFLRVKTNVASFAVVPSIVGDSVEWNRAYCYILGDSKEDLIGFPHEKES